MGHRSRFCAFMGMLRISGAPFLFGLLTVTSPAHAQPPAAPPSAPAQQAQQPAKPAAPTAEDICHAIEVDAAENELPVECSARVIWQESRFNALAVSRKGAEGIAQFMPRTADWHGLVDPFNPIEALKHSASYLRELREKFGNLGLGRVGEWLAGTRALPGETRNYVAVITGWTADEWASPSPPANAETTIPQGVPCTRLANLILAPREKAQQIAS